VPSNPKSLRLTGLYRERLLQARSRVEAEARARWPTIEQLDDTGWPGEMGQVVARSQLDAVRSTAAYLTAFLALETGRRRRVDIDTGMYAGRSRDGRILTDALRSPIIGVLGKLKEGWTPEQALDHGLNRALRMVSVDFDHAHRQALTDTVKVDDRFQGWQRVTRGTCGACMALSGSSGPHFEVHPGCQCVPQPVVAGVKDLFPVATAAELFRSKTKQEQDAALGPDTAEKVRSGSIELSELVAVTPLATDQPDFITQATP
jgi:hypothetical protein